MENKNSYISLVFEYLKDIKGKTFTEEEAKSRIENCGPELNQKFKNIKNKSKEAVESFYKNSEEYLFDLSSANEWKVFKDRTHFTKQTMKANKCKTILDYGAGAGFACLEFAKSSYDVTYVDFRGELWDFAEWLFKKKDVKVNMITVDKFFKEDKKYDIVYTNDVLEHVYHLGRTLIKLTEAANKAIVAFYCYADGGELSQHIHFAPEANFYMFSIFRLHGFNAHELVSENVFVRKPFKGYKPILEG